jgi:hypothetical protein
MDRDAALLILSFDVRLSHRLDIDVERCLRWAALLVIASIEERGSAMALLRPATREAEITPASAPTAREARSRVSAKCVGLLRLVLGGRAGEEFLAVGQRDRARIAALSRPLQRFPGSRH